MQSEHEFLEGFWERLKPEADKSRHSERELSLLCGKGPNYFNTAFRRKTDISIHAFYSVCQHLALDPSRIMGMAEKVFVSERSSQSDGEVVEALLETALRLAKNKIDVDRPPSLDEILKDWRSASQAIDHMDPFILSFCDAYAPPTEDGKLEILSIGERGLTAEVLRSRDVEIMNRNLENSDPEISRTAAKVQTEVLSKNFVLTEKELNTPLLDGKWVSIKYDQLNLLVYGKDRAPRILVYPKFVSRLTETEAAH